MPIKYPPKRGAVLYCNFSYGGFKAPEMDKPRPVIVLSPATRSRAKLVCVVALSTTPPVPVMACNCTITLPTALHDTNVSPKLSPEQDQWIKGDLIATVSFDRLDRFRVGRTQVGQRRYIDPRVSESDMQKIEKCIRAALGLS